MWLDAGIWRVNYVNGEVGKATIKVVHPKLVDNGYGTFKATECTDNPIPGVVGFIKVGKNRFGAKCPPGRLHVTPTGGSGAATLVFERIAS